MDASFCAAVSSTRSPAASTARADGRTVVVDHKTASQGFSEAEVALDIQATAYIHAARELGHGDCAFEFHAMSKTSKSKSPALTVTPAGQGAPRSRPFAAFGRSQPRPDRRPAGEAGEDRRSEWLWRRSGPAPAERTPRDLDRLSMIARDAERLVEAGIYLPAPPGWQCATCAYGEACRKAYAGKAA